MYQLQWPPQGRFSGIMIIFVGETTTLIIYRGELKCPFDSEKERPQGLFWMFEELFVRHSLNDPTFFESYKEIVARYIENHPGISSDLTNFNMETISKKGEK